MVLQGRLAAGLAGVMVVALAAVAAARPVVMETFDSLLKDPEVLVVGQVTKVEYLKEENTPRWGPVQNIQAKVTVLRGIRNADGSNFQEQEITVAYQRYLEKMGMPPNGANFPSLRKGQVAMLPLKWDAVAGVYRFIREEDSCMIMPAVKEPFVITPTRIAAPPTAADFIQHEIAAVFIHGDYAKFQEMGRFLMWLGPGKTDLLAEALIQMLSRIAADAHWADIAAAVYVESGWTMKPALAELAKRMPEQRDLRVVATALSRVKLPHGERLIPLLFAHQAEGSAVAAAIAANYPDDPLTLTLERKALAELKPEALHLAYLLVKDGKHPLAEAALTAARKAVTGNETRQAGGSNFEMACMLLLKAGSDQDMAYLVEQVRAARDKDPALAELLLGLCAEGPTSGVLEVARQFLDSKGPSNWGGDLRLCDRAGLIIQQATKEDFGLGEKKSLAERDAALEKLRTWLKGK